MNKKVSVKKNISGFEDLVYQLTSTIPRGKVSTYKLIAESIGRPKSARAVGNALNKNPYAPQVPCHRVVRSDGRVGGFAGGAKEKEALLRSEGVTIAGGRVQEFEKALYGVRL